MQAEDTPTRNGALHLLPPKIINSILEGGGPRLWAIIACLNKHWKRTAEEFAAIKMMEEPRMERIPLKLRQNESPLKLYSYCMAQTFAIAQSTALQFGDLHCAAILTCGDDCYRDQLGRTRYKLYTWGDNTRGQLGNQTDAQLCAVSTSASDYENEGSLEGMDGCDLACEPQSVCLGYSIYNDSMEEEIMPVSVSCGAHHTAVITRRGDLITWGAGTAGQTGQGVCSDTQSPKKVQFRSGEDKNITVRIVACAGGGNETVAIDEKGGLWGCGQNQSAQLGLGQRGVVPVFQSINIAERSVRENREASSAVAVTVGSHHTAFLMSNGALYTCGSPASGRLGTKSAVATEDVCNEENDFSCPQVVETFFPRSQLSLKQYVTFVSCGHSHSLAITLVGVLKAWGGNDYGQLGLGDTEDRYVPTDVPVSTGSSSSGPPRAVFVAAGYHHSCALFIHGGRTAVHTAGHNVYGQLGLGHTQPTSRFEKVEWFQAQEPPMSITTVTCGSWHTGAVDKDQNLYMWGRGDAGQIGNNQCNHQTLPVWLDRFTVAHPGNTLHRTNRPKPKLRPRQPNAEATRQALNQAAGTGSRRKPPPENPLQQIPLARLQGNMAHENHQRSFSAPARDNSVLGKLPSPTDAFAGCVHSPSTCPSLFKRRTRAVAGSSVRSRSASAMRSNPEGHAAHSSQTRLQHAVQQLSADPSLLESEQHASESCVARGEIPCSFPFDSSMHSRSAPIDLGVPARPSRPFNIPFCHQGQLQGTWDGAVPPSGPRTRSQARRHRPPKDCRERGLSVAERATHSHAGPCIPVEMPCGVGTAGFANEDEAQMTQDANHDPVNGFAASCSTLYRNSNNPGSSKKQRTQAVQKKLMVVRKRGAGQGKGSSGRGKTSGHAFAMRPRQDESIDANRS